MATLRPPFLGDSFPSLKRAVVAGRYSPLPRKYSDALGRVISQMLRVNARERPSADTLLRSPELVAKLALDEVNHYVHKSSDSNVDLMETIKVPGNLRHLNCALPKPCYPDVRPNSPSAWTVAEQKVRRPPAPPSGLENMPSIQEDPVYSAPTKAGDIPRRVPLQPAEENQHNRQAAPSKVPKYAYPDQPAANNGAPIPPASYMPYPPSRRPGVPPSSRPVARAQQQRMW